MNYSNLDLVILCGGKGRRLGLITKNKPKPLIKFNNIEFLNYLINFYKRFNFNKIYLLAGFKGHFFKKFNKKFFNSIKCEVIVEKKPLGTAGSLAQLKNKKINNFLLVNGDSFFDYDVKKFINKKVDTIKMMLTKNSNYKSNKKLSSLSVVKGRVYLNNKKSNLMNSGIYIFNKRVLSTIPTQKTSLEEDFLPNLIKKGKVQGVTKKFNFLDIGTPKNYKKGNSFLKKKFKKPAVFLERDTVINDDYGYINISKSFKWMAGSKKGMKFINNKNYYLFIIINHSGARKGLYSEDKFQKFNKKIKSYLINNDIYINDLEYCTHPLKEGKVKYSKRYECRKPNNKMLKNIFKNWLIDIDKSIIIGDSAKDKLWAEKLGIKFFCREKNLYKQLKKIIN